jgi:hypothetical protein
LRAKLEWNGKKEEKTLQDEMVDYKKLS